MEYLLPHLLQRSAERCPDRPAVRFLGRQWSYAELEARSNQLARALREAGVRRGDRVGLWLHKSCESVQAVYGVMKCGGVYVPLDPMAPVRRAAYIAQDCGIEVLVTDAVHMAQLAQLCEAGAPLRTAICLEEAPAEGVWRGRLLAAEEVRHQSCAPVDCSAVESDLAYILYTSGSTGTPKGVMIAHRTCLTFVHWAFHKFELGAEDRVTSMAPLHFDLSTFDLYATAKAGAMVVLVPEKLAALPVKLADLWQEERISVTYMVPSILSLLVQYGRLEAHDFSGLRLILFAGEVFPVKYLRKLVRAIPQATYYNLYGPTETNVCTYHRVRPEDVADDAPASLPIGRACENTEVFALDEENRPITQPGIEGELWVRGPTVAQGYWGDPGKTARSFQQNPLHNRYPDPVYRTGDVVKLADDGVTWLFLGRRDHMVKSRGYRIELGEIESVLYRHAEVKEAAAVAVPDELVGNRLHAFVVLTENARVTLGLLAAFCQQHLPPYMVPERFHLLEELPKTSTGKTDRPALVRAVEEKETRRARGSAEG
ncbi:amino acid adenylation domain-containing protein [Limisphaera sp. VF-2]|uniref:amino acid adenylation domain-containing protein n=1 Tax=Limisphaera sp. VF-2 TaxID=3400418 RepID=UPI0030957830